MRCPACGLMQMPSPICKSCGGLLGSPSRRPSSPREVPAQPPAQPPAKTRRSQIQKLAAVLGTGLLVLLVWGAVGFMLLRVWNYASRLDGGSKAYVDEVIPKIVASWNPKELMERASPEFIAAAPPEKIERIFRAFADRLGPLKRYEGSSGQVRVLVTPQKGKVTTASYVAEATFAKARASVQLNLVMHDGRWQILGFHVNSDALIP